MSGNYSDSEDEDGSYPPTTTTNVTLGFPTTEETGDALSHLGGEPTWLVPTSPPDPRLVKCSKCNNLMTLLIQLDGEVKESPHRRAFWVFVCVGGGKGGGCRGGAAGSGAVARPTKGKRGGGGTGGGKGDIKVLRGVVVRKEKKEEEKKVFEGEKKKKEKEEEKKGPGMGEMLFGGGSGGASGAGGNVNPFSMGGSALGGAGGNPFSIGGSGGGGGAFGGSSGGMFSTTTTTAPTTSSTTPKPPTITPTKSFAETLKQNLPPPPPQPADASSSLFGPPEPWPTPVPHTFPTYHLDAEYEQLDAISPETLLKNTSTGVSHIPSATDLLTNNNDSTTSGGGGGADEWGGYTKSDLDSTFQTFADRVSQNPEQVLRYEHRGTPLLYSKSDPVGALLSKTKGAGVPKCKNCGKDRTFEFQVMPHAIAVLEEGDLDALASLEEEAGMEWGTLIVYSCTCVPRTVDEMGVGYVEEWVGVQYEQRKR